jgi:GTP cyclohydrolase IB
MLEDVQNRPDPRGIELEAVGVTGVRRPVVVSDGSLSKQQTIADISLSVPLAGHLKGAHLSRFMEALDANGEDFTLEALPNLLKDISERLGTDRAQLEVLFPYFRERLAPITGARGLIDYQCRLIAVCKRNDLKLTLEVDVPVSSLCPCSRAISDYGAHNQRGHIIVQVTMTDPESSMITIEELADLAEQAASSPLYPVLKRPDERFVTMHAYDHPAFVEDMVRSIVLRLQDDDRVTSFEIEAVNDESIHNHAAFARASWRRP